MADESVSLDKTYLILFLTPYRAFASGTFNRVLDPREPFMIASLAV